MTDDSHTTPDFSDSHFLTTQEGMPEKVISVEMGGLAQAHVRTAITGDAITLSLTQARQIGRWLCERADEFEPQTPIARLKKAIRWRLGR